MTHSSTARAVGMTLLLAGCTTMHLPPPADMGAPLPPGAARAEGLDLAVGGQLFLYYPVAFHLRGSRAIDLGEGPLALELGGNVGFGWAGVNPALHWAPPPRPGGYWRFGSRLGLLAGAGDLFGEIPYADPYLGASLHGQASRVWDNGRALTLALGWGYTGHTRCWTGCGFDDPGADPSDPDPPRHSYLPYNAPSLHLRADLPAGRDGYAWMFGLGAQPVISSGDLLPMFNLSTGLHHKDPGPHW